MDDTRPSAGLPPGLSRPARRALEGAGASTLEDVARMTEDAVRGLHGMGPKGIGQLREALAARGLHFRAPAP
ncbi:hypothetical protein [Wenxinia marina]|uniref:Wenxma_15, whole genome shotgun sequence n=1 Tax=Wenxinia marina DSM 24838 TaxID=1123501 RepID=A0A0D0Q0Z4_9RHOB|nr:hypothetical protein [Wenxinia marina]KIQ68189.1 hypothetical protein Wenmar_03199 [Wenxinia marina DSM 24838]GGL76646.1 hypothetical protein GCM10011392_33830 [Wenxinia marina]